MKKQNNYSFILKHGVKIYPVYQHIDEYAKGELKYSKNNWYIEIDNNGTKIKYSKSIFKGKRLIGEKIIKQIDSTVVYWVDLIKKQLKNGTN